MDTASTATPLATLTAALNAPTQPTTGSAFQNLAELLRFRAAVHPYRTACIFLVDGDQEQRLSYRQLDERARAIAVELRERGAEGQRALLLFRPGLDYIATFIGCLYAGVVAIPAYPPDVARIHSSLPRLQAIVRNARPDLALTTTDIRGLAQGLMQTAPDLAELDWMTTDDVPAGAAARYQRPLWDPALPAFLQYTSGSTGDPKGVELSHGNLMTNLAMIQRTFRMTEADRVVSWLPPYHDMGLIGTILEPFYVGAEAILMSPLAFLRRPRRWLEAVSKYRGTVMGGPNFAYGLCVRKTRGEALEALDLSSLEVAFVGAEPIRGATLDSFAEHFGPRGFRRSSYLPCYGLAEATLLVSGAGPWPSSQRGGGLRRLSIDKSAYERGTIEPRAAVGVEIDDGITELVGAGFPAAALSVRIVDPATGRPAEDDRIGEIWVAGRSVSSGYWGRPQATAATFGGQLDDVEYLRTGDLGFLHEGELFVSGRLKDLIIVNGRNVHPQDIEAVVERSHDRIRPGSSAAFSCERDGREQLIIVAEVTSATELAIEEITNHIRRAVANEHRMAVDDVVLVPRSQVPKTTSGKIRRRACRAAYIGDELERVAGNHDTSRPGGDR